ncbi:putative glutamine/gamma-aminobutyrate antiporter GadC [Mycoplasma hafezii]|uniref:putative glutamine/gamma-aminobutyrate antiporter GadC n=1 Tax=Mycoplasma hafezii TaxID=525886 RepID=UPI003CE84804
MGFFKHSQANTSQQNLAASTGIKTPQQTAKNTLSLFSLVLMNIVAVVSLRGLPAEAEYGLGSIFYYVFAAIFFLVPVAMVAAELASTYPEKGGVFRWVGEAFGPKIAFLAMFLLWSEVTIWFPTALTFGAVSLAYIIPDSETAKWLASNKWFVLAIVLAIYWGATALSSLGTAMFAKVAKWGGIIGTIIPVIILIGFGFAWIISGHASAMKIQASDLIPEFNNFNSVVLAASVFLFYAGMEMNAIHVTSLKNPKRNYPIAIMISSIVTVFIFVLGTLAIGFILPAKDINLTEGLLVTFRMAFEWAGVPWLGPVLAIMLAIGVLAGIVTWVSGPSNGMLAIGKAGYLPRWFQKTNKKGVPTHLLLVQGAIVTVLSIVFVVLPSVQASYQILSQLTVILYLLMYLLMFAAAIYLRYSQPNRPRPYRIPGPKNIGMWIFAGLGFCGSLLAFIVSFAPPSQIDIGSPVLYVAILLIAAIIFTIIPFVIFKFKKDHWLDPNTDFAPFTWQIENTHPGIINHSSGHTDELSKSYFENKIKSDLNSFDAEIKKELASAEAKILKEEQELVSKLEKEALSFEKEENKKVNKAQKSNEKAIKALQKSESDFTAKDKKISSNNNQPEQSTTASQPTDDNKSESKK